MAHLHHLEQAALLHDTPASGPTMRVVSVSVGGSRLFWACKRLSDIVLSLIMLALALPLALILLVLNPKSNPGPLFYRQERAGRDLVPFRIWKFRTMVGKSEIHRFAPYEADRLRQLGRFLRQAHLDELPQAINVLLGQMSVVGPRPEQSSFVAKYLQSIPSYHYRYMVRPGISGLAQVEQGYTHTHQGTARKLRYDLFYIRKAGFWMEFYVYWKTAVLLIRKALHIA
ncbi:UDP-N-acetylgalactosamine-undecaprenyl-phosphate N-acetylgalactosaminephosphotransferase [Aliiroseovarius sp. xm-m-379]|uniref:sugar transferase n=2 Tax=unclassified Aliiroseovarius TaxID=2623558 RepID=UPI00156A64B0|nr:MULTISPECIES: sugar transferase [unclassified Aliiroseovarius]NRP35199.1 UDP-N-acetylgalactosamine-undecaprenyl-phosphate N-acetylgalactosaminephosphotransferase [Aliiroseovarius sp. xm-a-104]NRQ04787.1 UDP-N-acetylgalactosamine-undecaprenyl-phosphate N-acetylgalactosaminephosphotransferase [Aliiroseovarius sp. xm-m-309]NRQ22321.1 UDP-N-acetylgalactosamine-undecaprenyl-phosphate N-acetylgalactosaminephosphotransferase [Aliiroseovarius sp. xm-v-204]NRP26400.1 UDP-N-acetylgalactosamine-undecap